MTRHFSLVAVLTLAAPLLAADPPKAEPVGKPKGVCYAVLVACGEYDPNELRKLPYPRKETDEFRQVLLRTGFDEKNVKFLHDAQERRYLPERRKVADELDLLLGRAGPDDTVVVLLNGHGVHFAGDATGYFCPVDAKLTDKSTLLAMDGKGGVFELLKACKARRKVLLVNACRNDPRADQSLAGDKVKLDDEDADEVPAGIAALYSCKPGERSYYYDPADARSKGRERSLYMHHLIEAWGKGGKTTIEDVFAAVRTNAAADADALFGRKQNPVVRREYTGGGEWVVGGGAVAIGVPIVAPGFDPTGGFRFAHFAPNGDIRALVTVRDTKAERYEAWVVDPISGKTISGPLKHKYTIAHAAFNPEGETVVTTSLDGTAALWDAASGKRVAKPLDDRRDNYVNHAAFSPDGKTVVTGSYHLITWDTKTGDELLYYGLADSISHVAFSPDGTMVMAAKGVSANEAVVWDVKSGEKVAGPLEHKAHIRCAAFSPDGKRVVTASDDMTAGVWDVATGKRVAGPLQHAGNVFHAVFSPDGTRVVTASGDKTAVVWDATTGKKVAGPLQHTDLVHYAAFSPDGTRVVTASEDKTAVVWDAATGKKLVGPLEHDNGVLRAAFSRDGKRLVTIGYENTAAVAWDAITGEKLGSATVK